MISDYSYIFPDGIADYLLLRDERPEPRFSIIFCNRRGAALLIEDDRLFQEVANWMYEQGVPVVDSLLPEEE